MAAVLCHRPACSLPSLKCTHSHHCSQSHTAFLTPSRENTTVAKRLQAGISSGPVGSRDIDRALQFGATSQADSLYTFQFGLEFVRICLRCLYQPEGLLRART